MGSSTKQEPAPSIATPVILGAVSAVAILALLTVLLSMHRKKCCSKPSKLKSKGYEGRGRTLKGRKIGYDIPRRSKPIMSAAVWQQEENDIADEVKKNYGNISNCSNPVLFELTGFEQQDEFKQIAIETSSFKITKQKKIAQLHSILKKSDKVPLGTNTHRDQIEQMSSKEPKAVLSSPDCPRPAVERSYCAENQNICRDAEVEENAISKVQNWVNNSIAITADMEGEIKMTAGDMPDIGSRVVNEKPSANRTTEREDTEKPKRGNFEAADKASRASGCQQGILRGSIKEKTVDVKEDAYKKEKEECILSDAELEKAVSSERKPKYSAEEDFETAKDVKKLIVTRWIDHATRNNRPCIVEEESDTALGEKSLNELEYEEIDSILTSVSRMDERRVSKLKATEFYKQLLLKKLQKQSNRNHSQSIVERIEEEGRASKVEAEKQTSNKEGESYHDGGRNIESHENAKGRKETVRQSLSESSIHDAFPDMKNTDNKATKKVVEQHRVEAGNENEAFVKYSIVRNFSDRYNPLVYVSLTHIYGLGRLFGYDNSVVARLYLAGNATEDAVEESGQIPSDDNIYLEEMFSVKGASAKAIISDSLVVEMIFEDSENPELHVVLPLGSLRHKATLIDSVPFEKGCFRAS